MNNYYFTFGQAHTTKSGIAMKDKWVRVVARDYYIARQYFIDHFTSVEMKAPNKWSFQYDDNNFEPSYFPEGEYICLEAE